MSGMKDNDELLMDYLLREKRRKAHERLMPFNDLPPLPPKFKLCEEVSKKLESSKKALEDLKKEMKTIPNPSSFYKALLIMESKTAMRLKTS